MKVNKKALFCVSAAILILNLLSLAARYISTYHTNSGIFSEISGHFTTLTEAVLPLVAAVGMLVAYSVSGRLKAPLLCGLAYSLSWFITLFAEYFISHSYAGYVIPDALLLSAGWALLMTVTMYAELTVLFFIIIFAVRIFASRRYGKRLNTNEYINSDGAFDFQNPVTVGIFSASAAIFLYNLGIEIANTVSYLASSGGIYTAGELFYLVFEYVYILALFIFAHYVAHCARAILIKLQA